MKITNIDHIVLTVSNIETTTKFYSEILGMSVVKFGDNRTALTFGNQKINLHQKGEEIDPKAENPICGSADLCLIAETSIETVLNELKSKNIEIIDGIVDRAGAVGVIKSIYFRDPDNNLIEISNYEQSDYI